MDCEKIYTEANKAGCQAVDSLQVKPMTIADGSREYFVADGVCGFAWINFKGNTKFGRFCKQQGLSRKDSYYGGQTIWVSQYNQSMQMKEAYAKAFASVLNSYNIEARAMSRMD